MVIEATQLKLLDDHKGLDVSFTLGIIDGYGTQESQLKPRRFKHTFKNSKSDCGHLNITRYVLEQLYAKNGYFAVLCTIDLEDKVTDESNALVDISKLLKTGEMADVKFEVDGEIFPAHRLILAARSPVFKAELLGSMCETRMDCIKIKDMKPEVFKALLHFVYTYLLPDGDDINLIQHLLVAADRYAIKELITKCEQRLIENISLDTVLGFLNCAERHKFNKLKVACLEMVAQMKNFIQLALTEEYNLVIQDFPCLLADLRNAIFGNNKLS